MCQVGEKLPVKVLREGAVVDASIVAAKANLRIRRWLYNMRPDYFVYGGFVFTTVSYDYLVHSEPQYHDHILKSKEFPEDEAVAISFCFADKGVEGYLGADKSLVRSINGVKVTIFTSEHYDDKEIYLIGASLKDLGAKCFAFTKLDPGAIRGIKKSAFASSAKSS